ncbi:hypothetical protein AGMMS49942_15130 [Spirochaetia bacterium]|nr:hypothetical protein AGMMS49942_15130 [Spirochaetia bacterium]
MPPSETPEPLDPGIPPPETPEPLDPEIPPPETPEPLDPEIPPPETPEPVGFYTLTVPMEAAANLANIKAAIATALGGKNPANPGAGKAWTVRIIGLNLGGSNLTNLYTGVAASLSGDIDLDLSACTGNTIACTDTTLVQTVRDRFIAITLGEDVKTLAEYDAFSGAFCEFSRLRRIHAPGVTRIGDWTFRLCVALEQAEFPNAQSLGIGAFQSCATITAVSFPLVTTVALNAFNTCASLQTVSLPKAVSIGGYAFNVCPALTSLTLGPTIPSFGDAPFGTIAGDPNTITITVPAGKKGAYESAFSSKVWGRTNITIKFAD